MSNGWAWHAAWSEHAGWLRRVLLSRLGETHAVDEVMQEVAVAAAELDEAPETPPAWLYRVAIRLALIRRRKLGRERRRNERIAAEPPNNGSGDPLSWLLAVERNERVREALARLPDRAREILLLKYSENWTAKQIAERLGMKPNAVDARLHRARMALRHELTTMGEDDVS